MKKLTVLLAAAVMILSFSAVSFAAKPANIYSGSMTKQLILAEDEPAPSPEPAPEPTPAPTPEPK